MTRQCLKFAGSCGDNGDTFRFLNSVSVVLRRSLYGVDWNLRDTAVEFIDGTFLEGLCSLFVASRVTEAREPTCILITFVTIFIIRA